MRPLSCLLLATLLLLPACGGGQRDAAVAVTSATSAPRDYAGRPSGFGDADPHEWERPPYGLPVHGVDVSRYNTGIDWARAAASGVSFAYIKATEGGDRVDPLFRQHWADTARAGIPRGAYHFYYHCRPGREQAAWFIATVPKDPHMLPPVLDVEWTPTSPTCTRRPPAAEVRREMRDFLEIVAAHYGVRPLIYTATDFFADNGLASFTGYEWWLRAVSAHPGERYPGTRWTFWQYSGTGLAPGFPGQIDLNAFNGSPAAFARWRAARTPPP
ncbi:glycosyl hydrolase, family 25 [Oceanicola granulosus HTCC2516]|uniref:Glycosyl hydrolase, family 25 n=1 Tax=Oceanicola granulosus (strain ATCC BAA-861 / DSM 15982 / KCTC 12143 / HTCC2516) TaxID=314256 RepID=Q2CA82_OCEGH|nr:GH25 family lysozyme [Oceanicola granulosus]EAR49563.1 glycosyl hydrolase, family 25 [Oceanicola granulosus HTCC2516]